MAYAFFCSFFVPKNEISVPRCLHRDMDLHSFVAALYQEMKFLWMFFPHTGGYVVLAHEFKVEVDNKSFPAINEIHKSDY